MINIRELIADPDFCQPNGISITRYTQSVVNHRVENTPTELNVTGIITIRDNNEDELLPEADTNKEAINIFTYERLKTVGIDKHDEEEYSSDIVHFNGVDYIVRVCLDDEQYGFCRSVAVKIERNLM